MELTEEQLSILHPDKAYQQQFAAALAPHVSLEDAQKAGIEALNRTRWSFGGKNDLDDTADGHFSCDFPAGSEDHDLQKVLAAIAATQLTKGGCALRGIESPYRQAIQRVIISEKSAVTLQDIAPGMKLGGWFVEAGRAANPVMAR